MTNATLLTGELAAELYRRIESPDARAFLDHLIDHPDQQFDSDAMQVALGFREHRQVAQAAYAVGEIARGLGLARPWKEAQRGYLLPADQSAVLKQARGR